MPDHSDHTTASPDASTLNHLGLTATTHCMIGCVIGEIAGLAIASALGWGAVASIALAVALAYLAGFTLTSLPLLRAGLALSTVVPIALATDTVSITIMEAIDNAFIALIPGALQAGLADWLMWAAMAGGFAIAYPFVFLANRALIKRGKGHAHVHQYHH